MRELIFLTMPGITMMAGVKNGWVKHYWMDSLEVLQKNLKTAREFKPMSEEEISALLSSVIKYSMNGQLEEYKTYEIEPEEEEQEG
jgi:hypothetical protein